MFNNVFKFFKSGLRKIGSTGNGYIKHRNVVKLEEIYKDLEEPKIAYKDFEKLWKFIGSAYHSPPEKLRLTDRFDHELKKIDPWPIDGAVAELEDELKRKNIKTDKRIHNLKEYMLLYFGVIDR